MNTDPRDDHQLLQDYLAGSDQAFAELAHRHSSLVYSAALRQTRDSHTAEDVTQAVFILLTQKACHLGPKTVLSAWLYRASHFSARDAMKKQRRRQFHEAHLASVAAKNQSADDTWLNIAPLLDDAMAQLRQRDRTAILLRYFENKSLRDVGTILGTNEDTAGHCVNRAVERLRKFFARRGLTVPAGALTISLTSHAVGPAPATATTAAAAATSASPAPAATIAKGAATMMFWTKTKIALIAAILVVAIAVPPLLLDARAQTQIIPHPAAPNTGQPIHVDLPGGTSIELPCLVGTGADGDKIWAPDGTLLNPSPIQVSVDEKGINDIYLFPGQRIVQMPLHWTVPNGEKLDYSIMAGNNARISGQAMRDGKPIENSCVWGETFDSTNRTTVVRLFLKLDPWQLLATWDSQANNMDIKTDDAPFDVEAATPAVRDGKLLFSLTVAYDTLHWGSRIFAVLKDGTRIQADTGFIHRIANANVIHWSFPPGKPLNADDVVRYELELTPMTEITINNVSLFPNQLTHPTVKLTPPPALFKLKPSLNQPGGL